MVAGILRSLRWSLSLGAKFARVVPWQTSLIVLLTLVSQISTLLAFVLPLKVVILLGSDRIPRYIPEALAAMGHDALIVALGIATVVFFLVYLLAERAIAWITVLASRRLLLKSQKLALFENQEQVAESAYERFSRTVAGGIFAGLALLGLAVFYPNMFWVVTAYAGSVTLLLLTLATLSDSFRERLDAELAAILNLTAGIGFFAVFAFLVADFIFLTPPGVIIAIVSLLLSRQIFGRLAGIVQDMSALHTQRTRYDALFFHGRILLREGVKEEKTLWPLLERNSRDEWVSGLLAQRIGDWQAPLRTIWHPSGVPNVAALRVPRPAEGEEFLIKIFESNRKSLASHESALLSEPPKGLPAPVFVERTEVKQFPCLVYTLPSGSPVTNPRRFHQLAISLRAQLLQVEPPAALITRYRRSHPMLWQRADSTSLLRLRVAVDTAEQEQCATEAVQRLPALRQHLDTLPLVLLNPDITQATIWVDEVEEKPLLLNWTRWSLEPAGAGWGDREEQLEKLVAALEQGVPKRACLARVHPEQAKLAALTYALEGRLLRQQFPEALDLVARILELLDLLDGKHRDSRSGSR
jgi:hypothetical protein